MLSNSARRLSTALSRHQRNSLNFSMHRCFSAKPPQPGSAESSSTKSNTAAVVTPPSGTNADPANAAPKPTQPRSLPTRHSRHHRPAVAPSDVLDSNSETILASIPGTLFSYNSKNLHQSKTEEYEQALHECHSMQQKVEYLLRGYSSLLPGSIVDIASTEKAASTKDGDEIVAKMIKLLDRMEQEGKTYVELRSKFRSQLAHVSQTEAAHSDTNEKSNSSEDASDIGDSDPELPIDENTNTNAWKLNALVANFGAPPGPTNVMYDLILDAIAITIPSSKDPLALLRQSREIHSRSVRRYELDAKAGTDHMNPSSCPTPATFNAVIRAATAIQTGNDEVRDTAIENGLYAFNTMFHHTIVHRNSSTYKYTLDMIRTHFPPGEMRGNIVAGIWEKAVQDKVIDLAVIDAMRGISSDAHGELFDQWWKSVEEQFDANVKNGHGFPIVWGKYKKLRRFDKRFQTY